MCIKDDPALKDGYVEVKFKPISGKEDQAGGLIWRAKKKAIEWDDATFKDAGRVGLWTKADSVTLFDDFSYGAK